MGVIDLTKRQLTSVLNDLRFSAMPFGDGSVNFFPELEVASRGQTRPPQLHSHDKMSFKCCLMYTLF